MPNSSKACRHIGGLIAIALSAALLHAADLSAQPDFGSERRIGDLLVFSDHEEANRFYYAPGKLRLAERHGAPDVLFLLTRYVGTAARGDQGETSYFARLTFGIEMDGPSGESIRAAARRISVESGEEPEVRPLPIRRLEAQVVFTPIGTDAAPDTLEEGHFEADRESERALKDGFWQRRTYSLRLDRYSAEAVWKTLQDDRALVSFTYAFIAEGVPGGSGSGDARFSSTSDEDLGELEASTGQDREPGGTVPPTTTLDERSVLADAFAVELDPARHADLIVVHDLNERYVDPAYSVLDVRCYDFRNGLRPDLWMKRVELAAQAVNGRTARVVVTFRASEPDLHAQSVRFPYAVRMDQPLRYRVVEVALDGSRKMSDWREKESWVGLIDVTSSPDDSRAAAASQVKDDDS